MLIWYFDKVPNKIHESSLYVYLHCDVLDKQGYTTTIINLMFPLVEQHDEKLKLGSYIWLNLFGMCWKLTKGFEKGGMHFVIQVLSIIIVLSF